MPTALRIKGYRLHFWSADRREPAHVHVERDACTAKFWLNPVRLASKRNFTAHDIRLVEKIVVEHEAEILGAWNEHFGR